MSFPSTFIYWLKLETESEVEKELKISFKLVLVVLVVIPLLWPEFSTFISLKKEFKWLMLYLLVRSKVPPKSILWGLFELRLVRSKSIFPLAEFLLFVEDVVVICKVLVSPNNDFKLLIVRPSSILVCEGIVFCPVLPLLAKFWLADDVYCTLKLIFWFPCWFDWLFEMEEIVGMDCFIFAYFIEVIVGTESGELVFID